MSDCLLHAYYVSSTSSFRAAPKLLLKYISYGKLSILITDDCAVALQQEGSGFKP